MTNKKVRRGLVLGLLSLVFLFLYHSPAGAVDIAGKILGTITDQSGAVVPDAMVVARSADTGVETKVMSDSNGSYAFESLLPGVYSVSCEKTGFKKYLTTDIRVITQQTTTLNINMLLGAVTEEIQVSAAATQVDTATPTIQSTLGRVAIDSLPVTGRDIRYNAELLQPGAVAGENESGVPMVRVNGIRGNVNNYRVDGSEINDYFHGTSAPFPPAENLQEFTVLSNSYGAQYGTAGGSQVSAIIKSGTNDIHGAGWAYFGNEAWDANSWQANAAGIARPSGSQRWWGGNVGGPVYIPGVYNGKDKTFFFFSYEYTKPTAGTFIQQVVPTAEEREGIFTNSLGGIPVINGVPTPTVDPTTFSAMAQGVLASPFLPLPNGPNGAYDWVSHSTDTTKTMIVKIDQQLGSKNRLFGTFYWYHDFPLFDSQLAYIFDVPNEMPNGGTGAFPKYLQSWTFNETYNATSNILNNIIFAIKTFNNSVAFGKIDPNFSYPNFGMPNEQVDTGGALTQVGIGVGFEGYVGSYPTPGGFTLWGNYADNQKERDFFISDNLTWIKGRHTIQAGYEQRIHNQSKQQNAYTAGGWTFDTAQVGSTGNAMADFLLGDGASIIQGSLLHAKLSYPSREPYVSDQIKVSRKLTATLGLRWSPFFGVTEANGHLSAFRPGEESTLYPTAPLGLVVPGDPGIPPATFNNKYRNLGPRVGIAYTPRANGKSVIRVGYGMYYDFQWLKGFNSFANTPPYGLSYNPVGPVDTANPYNGASLFPYSVPPPGSAAAKAYVFPPATDLSLLSQDPNYNSGRIHQYNVSYEWEPWKDYLFTFAYVGTRGTHLRSSTDLNMPLFIPNASTLANEQSRRPYPQVTSIVSEFSGANSWYNSMQISLNKRFAHGFTIISNYTLSKNTDSGDTTGRSEGAVNIYRDPNDRRLDYGISDYDIRHSLSVGYAWQLPFVKRANRWTKVALGSWTWGGTLRAVSGTPMNVTGPDSFDDFSAEYAWANYVGGSVYGDHSSRASQAAHWLNPNAFCPANATGAGCTVDTSVGVTSVAFGNAKRGVARGPGGFYNDMTLEKTFPFSERWGSLNFRASATNVFNHTVLQNPGDTNIADARSTFGVISTAAAPRTLMLAIRYLF
jgi:hypothetical protein